MMTVAVLLMAAVSGQQGLAAQDADESVLPDMGNVCRIWEMYRMGCKSPV